MIELEKILAGSIDRNELLEIGIPLNCIPQVIGSLPCSYNLGVSRVKGAFSDLPSLKRLYIDKALLHLYSFYLPKETASVVIFTWVIGDGWGDYFAQIEAAKILRKRFPTLSIELLTLVHNTATLPKTEHQFPSTILLYTADLDIGWEKVIYEEPPASVISQLKNASLILQIPTYFPHTKQFFASLSLPKHELVGEAGWIDTPNFQPNTMARCMGLHFLEKGIFIKEMPKIDFSSALKNLENQQISSLLSEKKTRLNVAYTRYDSGLYLYIHALLKSLEKDNTSIDLCLFHLGHFIENFERQYRDILKQYGIQKVVIFYQKNTTHLSVSTTGKLLRLIHLEKMKHEDYLLLVSHATDVVGCRGDGSIFEAISSNKIFFLDISYHERTFLKNLITLASHLLPSHPKAVAYLKLFLSLPQLTPTQTNTEWTEDPLPHPLIPLKLLGEAMGELLQSEEVAQGFNILNLAVQKNYAFNSVLCNLTQRALLHHDSPQIAILESVALDGYLHHDKSAKEMLLEIRSYL